MYIDPAMVKAPQKIWTLHRVIFNTGPGGWSICDGLWDGLPAVGMRWNGSHDEQGQGNPQSTGHPTWFILPDEVVPAVRATVEKLKEQRDGIDCQVWSPEGYDDGAWKIRVVLSPTKRKGLANPWDFPLPKKQNAMYRGDDGFRVGLHRPDTSIELGGRFVDGVWEGHFFASDIRSKAEAIADEIRHTLVEAINSEITDAHEPNVDEPRR